MRKSLIAVGLCVLVGCPGKAPPDQNNPDAAADVDAAVTPTTLTMSGKVVSYFTGEALDTTAITTDGLVPAVATTSAADGTYMIDVAVGSKLFAITSRTGARQSRSAVITVADQPLTQDLYVLNDADVSRQFATVGVAQTTGTILAAELQKNNGTPFEGLPLASITLVDNANVAVPGISGPYFFGNLGDIKLPADLAVSTAYGLPLRARVAFLNVPTGSFKLLVAYTNGMGQPATNTTPVAIGPGGATLALSGGMMPQMAMPPPTDPTFAVDIYPRLQRASQGGLGCANCHTATGPTGAKDLPYDGTPTATLALMTAAAGVLTLATPATSLFLTKPLYEVAPPQNHPNATFLDVNDADYKLFLLWVTNGAKP